MHHRPARSLRFLSFCAGGRSPHPTPPRAHRLRRASGWLGRGPPAPMRQDKVPGSLRRGARGLKRQSTGGGGVGTILSNVLKKRSCISRTAPRLLCTLEPGKGQRPRRRRLLSAWMDRRRAPTFSSPPPPYGLAWLAAPLFAFPLVVGSGAAAGAGAGAGAVRFGSPRAKR